MVSQSRSAHIAIAFSPTNRLGIDEQHAGAAHPSPPPRTAGPNSLARAVGVASYSVFVRFRRKRLTLSRGIRSLDAALAFADRLRRERFHDPDSILVIDDRSGEAVCPSVPRPAPAALEAPPERVIGPAPSRPMRPFPAWPLDHGAKLDRMARAVDAARSASARHLTALEARLDTVRSASASGHEAELRQLEELLSCLHRGADVVVALERTIATLRKTSAAPPCAARTAPLDETG